jgi:hypothetical protein
MKFLVKGDPSTTECQHIAASNVLETTASVQISATLMGAAAENVHRRRPKYSTVQLRILGHPCSDWGQKGVEAGSTRHTEKIKENADKDKTFFERERFGCLTCWMKEVWMHVATVQPAVVHPCRLSECLLGTILWGNWGGHRDGRCCCWHERG